MKFNVVISDFEYEKDKNGNTYGWGVARYELPEYRFGEGFVKNVYQREPEESLDEIMQFLKQIHSKENITKIEKMIRKGAVKEL